MCPNPQWGTADVEIKDLSVENGELKCSLFKPGAGQNIACLLYTSPSPRDILVSRMPSSA